MVRHIGRFGSVIYSKPFLLLNNEYVLDYNMADDARWSAVVARDAASDGKFVYCVKTTKIFCRPICKARLARRANVEFYDTPAEAQAAGYRACKRCQPLLPSYTPEADKVRAVCDLLDALSDDEPLPELGQLAAEVGLTKHHFHRLFKRETGLTPREYALAARCLSGRHGSSPSTALTPITPIDCDVRSPRVVDDTLQANHSTDLFACDGDKASSMQRSDCIYYSIIESTFGLLLVAFNELKVVRLELGASEAELLDALELVFASSGYLQVPLELASHQDRASLQLQTTAVVEALERPTGKLLDISFTCPGFTGCIDPAF